MPGASLRCVLDDAVGLWCGSHKERRPARQPPRSCLRGAQGLIGGATRCDAQHADGEAVALETQRPAAQGRAAAARAIETLEYDDEDA